VAAIESVPYHRPDIGDEEIAGVSAVLRSGWLTTGPAAAELEREICRITGSRFAVAVNSCTSGLHAALIASGVGPGDEVITTPLTFCGTVQAIEETGATPVLVDVADDLNIDCGLIESAVTPRTRALLPVHLGGLLCDMEATRRIAARRDLTVVEDAAHALGAGCGAQGTAVFSFYENKNATTGEGGAVTTSDEALASRIRLFATHGVLRAEPGAKSGWRYEVVARGFKYNLSDVLAAIGVVQLRRMDEFQKRRDAIAARYDERFRLYGDEIQLPPRDPHSRHAWHLYAIRLKLESLEATRDEFIAEMEREGVGCSVHFRPIFMHPWFARLGDSNRHPVAAREFQRLVSLPIFPLLTDGEQAFVADRVIALAMRHRKRLFFVAGAIKNC
jgi:dTDP-4-amino-4,6-dideoxygalactose transaminase